jgi:hypothetical protein
MFVMSCLLDEPVSLNDFIFFIDILKLAISQLHNGPREVKWFFPRLQKSLTAILRAG